MKFNDLPVQWNYNHPLRMRVIDYQKILVDNLYTEDEIKHNNASHFFPPLKPDGTRTFQERQVLGLLESELYINRIIHSLSQYSDIKSFSDCPFLGRNTPFFTPFLTISNLDDPGFKSKPSFF